MKKDNAMLLVVLNNLISRRKINFNVNNSVHCSESFNFLSVISSKLLSRLEIFMLARQMNGR